MINNKIAVVALIACIFALSACTQKNNNADVNPDTQMTPGTQKSPATTVVATPLASFPATSDTDIKAIDKYFDNSDSKDFDDKALDELEK